MDILITLAIYLLGFFAVMLTIGFVAWIFVARHIWSNYKKGQASFDEMSERIKASRSNLDRRNKHEIDL